MDDLTTRKLRSDWLLSQADWHKAQCYTADSSRQKWHTAQYRWYRRKAITVFSLSAVIAWTFHKHSSAIAANIARSNALLSRLTRRP